MEGVEDRTASKDGITIRTNVTGFLRWNATPTPMRVAVLLPTSRPLCGYAALPANQLIAERSRNWSMSGAYNINNSTSQHDAFASQLAFPLQPVSMGLGSGS
ncbi:hypothetical protein OG21DRAFT_398870 [Imleria badia]|nr:hypothetical protein OG21DRAFT_398870 [Imleria badia]